MNVNTKYKQMYTYTRLGNCRRCLSSWCLSLEACTTHIIACVQFSRCIQSNNYVYVQEYDACFFFCNFNENKSSYKLMEGVVSAYTTTV